MGDEGGLNRVRPDFRYLGTLKVRTEGKNAQLLWKAFENATDEVEYFKSFSTELEEELQTEETVEELFGLALVENYIYLYQNNPRFSRLWAFDVVDVLSLPVILSPIFSRWAVHCRRVSQFLGDQFICPVCGFTRLNLTPTIVREINNLLETSGIFDHRLHYCENCLKIRLNEPTNHCRDCGRVFCEACERTTVGVCYACRAQR